jgi:hypothetical protein
MIIPSASPSSAARWASCVAARKGSPCKVAQAGTPEIRCCLSDADQLNCELVQDHVRRWRSHGPPRSLGEDPPHELCRTPTTFAAAIAVAAVAPLIVGRTTRADTPESLTRQGRCSGGRNLHAGGTDPGRDQPALPGPDHQGHRRLQRPEQPVRLVPHSPQRRPDPRSSLRQRQHRHLGGPPSDDPIGVQKFAPLGSLD